MQRARGGYTIVEVLIVLVVSVIIFVAAVTVFSGKQGKTEFAQAMRDVESRVQTAVNDVKVSTFPDASNYTCDVVDQGPGIGLRPRLSAGTSSVGTNTKCIFLGKAIFLDTAPDPDELEVYTVLGRRTTNGTDPVTEFKDSNPEPADQLTETYQIIFGATVFSAHEDTLSSTSTYLMGFYNSLLPSGATEGSQSLKTVGYVGINPASAGQVRNAIRDNVPGPYTRKDSKVWTICFRSGTSNESAQLIVNASFSGVTTQVNFTDCLS